MKLSLRTRLEQLATRLAELDHLLAAPETAADMDKFRADITRKRAAGSKPPTRGWRVERAIRNLEDTKGRTGLRGTLIRRALTVLRKIPRR